jgi:UrcA family protein
MSIFAISNLALALVAAGPAYAEPNHSWKVGNDSYHVYSKGLDLQTRDGRAAMLVRLERAAGKLCNAGVKVEQRECVATSVARAAETSNAWFLKLALSERVTHQLAAR